MDPTRQSLPNEKLQLSIEKTRAGEGFYLDPTKKNVGFLKKGHKVSRLSFTPTANKATAVYVATGLKASFLSVIAKHKFVPLDLEFGGETKTIQVNIGSLSKRLYLTASDIKTAAKDGKLLAFIKDGYQKHVQSEELRQSTLDEIARTGDKHITENSIQMMDLEKIIFAASKRLNNKEKFYHSKVTTWTQDHSVSIYITKSETENHMRVSAVSKEKLDEGSFGRVFTSTDLTTGESEVVKRAKVLDEYMKKLNESNLKTLQSWVKQHLGTTYDKHLFKTKQQCIAKLVEINIVQAEKDAKNELRFLQKINPEGNIPGIQRPPHRAYMVTDYEIGEGVGYIAPFYNIGPLHHTKTDELNGSECFDCVHQLLMGGNFCAQQNILLGDIKPKNCLMEKREEKYHVVLSDFGGARELSNINLHQWGTFTPGFYSESDHTISHGSFLQDHEMRELQLKRDVYALGQTLNETFLASVVESINQNPTTDRTRLKNDLERFLRKITHPSFRTRITMQQVLNEFTLITRNHAKTIEALPKPITNDARKKTAFVKAFNLQ